MPIWRAWLPRSFLSRSPSLYESASKIQILTLTLRPKCWSRPSSIVSLVRNRSVIFFLSLFFWIRLDRWNNRISKFLFSYTFSSRSRARVRCDWFLSRRVNQGWRREKERERIGMSHFPEWTQFPRRWEQSALTVEGDRHLQMIESKLWASR